MREKEDFRANLERLNEMFPSEEMLNITKISQFTGIERKTIAKDPRFSKAFVMIGRRKYLSKSTLARLICN